GPGAVVIKLGAEGSYFATEGDAGFVPPFNVAAIDSVGAGDAFNGALAVSLGTGLDLKSSVEIASAAGALAVTKTGAQDSMPMKADVERLLGN
ncbi:MAG TPA: ribokinase, partial [Dehalococcoidia bacterium]|nr:ribokinase [Dehalococcoidia bacterium]